MNADVIVTRYRGAALGWWGMRSPREQVLLAALGAVAATALYISLVYAPIAAVRNAALRDIRTYEALAAQLRVAGPTLLSQAAYARQDPSAVISATAAQSGLVIRRIDPDGGRVRVAVEDVPFPVAMRWLDQLERERGFRLQALRIEQRPSPGLINAQVTLERP